MTSGMILDVIVAFSVMLATVEGGCEKGVYTYYWSASGIEDGTIE